MLTPSDDRDELSLKRAASGRRRGLLTELWGMLKQNKKWWLAPLLLLMLIVGTLLILSTTAAAPFIYTLF